MDSRFDHSIGWKQNSTQIADYLLENSSIDLFEEWDSDIDLQNQQESSDNEAVLQKIYEKHYCHVFNKSFKQLLAKD